MPVTKIASEVGNMRYGKIILLGKLMKVTGIIKPESFEKALYSVLPPKKHYMIPDEMKVLKIGMEYEE